MLDFDVAQARLASAGHPPAITEVCPLAQARGRVLAQTLFATLDLPPADNSAMDGYAIRYADYAPGARLPVQQRCFAGDTPQALQPGNTIRVFTGSLMPAGADTIVMQENGNETDQGFEISVPPTLGDHVRLQGEDVLKGKQLFTKGTLLSGAEISLLASQGYPEIPVYAPLKIGIITTGDELANPGQVLVTGQIYNSNGPMLAALAGAMGAQIIHVLHALDTSASLHTAFETALNDCDLVLTVGGVSVGEKDLVKPTIEEMGGVLDLWRVCMKPGKPVALAYARNKPIICLPGNPVSAFVVFSLLVSPLMRTMQGRSDIMPPIHYGKLSTDRQFCETREEFLRVQASFSPDQGILLAPHPMQGSAIINSLPWADGLARIPVNTVVKNGDVVPYYDLQHWLS
ncbi:MAG: molybdopterin molybdotransferase MoeA [Burkholderiaceae bacterium]|nr:molybdopterin molybdotransferase MoeA [Burkholderiaceae bacterium]